MSQLSVPESSTEIGNTSKGRSQISPAKHWAFTWNNPPSNWRSVLELCSSKIDKFVYGLEYGDSGTQHVQGHISFLSKLRPLSLSLPKEIHWEKTRSVEHAERYCTKDGHYVTNIPHLRRVRDPMDWIVMRAWQIKILNILSAEPDDRKIFWLWDSIGCSGKSTFTKHLVLTFPDTIVCDGKTSDIAYLIANMKLPPRVVIWDIPRSLEEHVNYNAIEKVKNGLFTSTKYETKMVVFDVPHVIIFANFFPNTDKLSQ